MALPHLESEIFLGELIKVEVYNSATVLRYENFQQGAYTFENEQFLYAPFTLSGKDRKLELDTAQLELSVANIDLVRDVVRTFNGLRRAVVTVYTIFPDRLDSPPSIDRLQIASTSFNSGSINFTLSSPVSSISGQIPSLLFDTNLFPELPFSNDFKV